MKSLFGVGRGETSGSPSLAIIVAVLLALFLFRAPRVFAAAGDELLAAGQTYHQNGDYNSAITTLESFISQYPTSASRNKGELYLGCAYLARNGGDSDLAAARECFNYILTQGKSANYYRDALFHNARSYYNAKDYATAKTLLTQFLSEYPKDDFDQYAYYYLGVCETNVGSFDQAIAYYDRSEAEFPNSPLKWYCKLEKATLLGRQGQYAESDRQLAQIASDATAPATIVGQATIQRSLLMLVQNNAQGSVALLENYIQQHKNDASLLATVQDAYLYEAYSYFAMKEYQRALNLIDEVETLGSSLPPEAATVKIKLLLALGRTADAESLLERLAESEYGKNLPDLVTSYRAMIDAVLGNRDQVIANLGAMLSPRTTAANSNVVEFNYYNTSRNHLDPLDFVEACGVLTVAYAGRYAQSRNASDNAAQEALYQATARYVATLNDPAVTMVLNAIDQARKAALANAASSQTSNFSVIAPGAMNSGSPAGGDGFTPPPQNGRGQETRQGATPPTSRDNQNQGTNPNQSNNGNQNLNFNQNQGLAGNQSQIIGATPSYQPSPNPPSAGIANGALNSVFSQNSAASAQPSLPGAAQSAQYGAVAQTANQGSASYPRQTEQTTETTKLTPTEARAALEQATNFYANLEFDRANETLLEATTRSETFWTDCPAEAARISLLRANALLELGKRSEAQMVCEDVVAHAPNTPEASVAYYYLGSLADSVGRGEEAIDYLRHATSGRGDFPYADAALYYLGANELERGDVNSASTTFTRLYRDYPSSPYWSHAVWYLAKIESDKRRDVVAEKLVNEALGRRPDSAIVDYLLFLKGEIALRAKDYDKALVAFDMIVDQYPDSVWYSRAKNRLAAIPEQFLNGVQTNVVDDANRSDDSIPEPTPPRSAANAPIDRNLNGGGLENGDRAFAPDDRSSARIASPADLRERASRALEAEGLPPRNSNSAPPQDERRQGASGAPSTPSSRRPQVDLTRNR